MANWVVKSKIDFHGVSRTSKDYNNPCGSCLRTLRSTKCITTMNVVLNKLTLRETNFQLLQTPKCSTSGMTQCQE